MMILYDVGIHGNFGLLWRAQIWALERLISVNCAGGDVRWAIIALASRSFSAAWVFGQRQFGLLARNVGGRVGQGACFAADITDADSMVAAGGS